MYSEQLGWNRQQSPRYGETRRWYNLRKPIGMSLACKGKAPPFFPTGVRSPEGAPRTPMQDPLPGALSAPRWPSGSPPGRSLCGAGRTPAGPASPGCGPPRSRLAGRRRSRSSRRRARLPPTYEHGRPGRWCSAAWMRASPSEPHPGIRGRYEGYPPWKAENPPPSPALSDPEGLLPAGDRDGEPLPPFRTASGKDQPARRSRHAPAKSVGSQPPPVMWLVGAFHRKDHSFLGAKHCPGK
jgi:hypothetical protein